MATTSRLLLGVVLGALSTSCVSYSSIQKADKEVYLSGAVNYFVITVPFLKRCDVEGQILRCEELKEFEPSARRGGAGAGGDTSSPGSTPSGDKKAPPAPAPAPAPAK